MDIDLTAIFEREGIRKIELYGALDKFCVVLVNGAFGVAPTVGEALAKAKLPDAENVLRAA